MLFNHHFFFSLWLAPEYKPKHSKHLIAKNKTTGSSSRQTGRHNVAQQVEAQWLTKTILLENFCCINATACLWVCDMTIFAQSSFERQKVGCTSFYFLVSGLSLQCHSAPLTRRLALVLSSSYTTHRQTHHVERLALVLAGSPVLLQGFHWFGLESMWRCLIHHSVGPDWSAGFLRLRLFRFPAVHRGEKRCYCSPGQ